MRPSLQANSLCRSLVYAGVLAAFVTAASATPIVFTGQDSGAGPGSPHPNASAAAASFAAAAGALGTVSTITLENAPLGAFTSLVVAPGVTLSGTDSAGGNQRILNASDFPSAPSLDGFNTTPGGSHFVQQNAGSIVFTFTTPINSFGAFLTGVQTAFYQDTFTFSDGTVQTINVPGSGTSNSVGALDFVGFTDAGKSISSITIFAGGANDGQDYLGVDDIMYQTAAASSVTPEPSSFVLLLSGIGGLGLRYRRFKRQSC